MKSLFTTPWRYFVIALCLLLGTVTGGPGTKIASAASKVDEDQSTGVASAPNATSFVFLPLVAQEDTTGNATATISNDSNGAGYNPKIDPANFVTGVNNPYFTLKPGTIWVYEGTSPEGASEKDQVEVLNDTKVILGVTTTVVRDRVWEDGQLVEDTYDWYAQDNKGTVWYFGENATNYDGDVINHDGSWEAGVDKAKPGIVMQADPVEEDDPYRQEYLKGEAEDWAQVISTNVSVKTKLGKYEDCIKTKEWTPLEPGIVEEKTYCKEVGNLVKAEGVAGESGQTVLTSVTTTP